MEKVYMKVMVSFDGDIEKIAKDPVTEVRKALTNGVMVDGEVYFPMTDYNEKLYEVKNDGFELNVDSSFDGDIIRMDSKPNNKCICAETDCVLSATHNYKGNTIFADLRLDMDDSDRQPELDINLGFYNSENNQMLSSEWSESLQINYCPICGRKL